MKPDRLEWREEIGGAKSQSIISSWISALSLNERIINCSCVYIKRTATVNTKRAYHRSRFDKVSRFETMWPDGNSNGTAN